MRVNVRDEKTPQVVWDLALAFGCTDWARCNNRVMPYGSCPDCLANAASTLDELEGKGYELKVKVTN